jgi:hypothetical protein
MLISNTFITTTIQVTEFDYMYVCMYVCMCGMSCVRKDNPLLRCCIDIYCSRTLYRGELEEFKLAGR